MSEVKISVETQAQADQVQRIFKELVERGETVMAVTAERYDATHRPGHDNDNSINVYFRLKTESEIFYHIDDDGSLIQVDYGPEMAGNPPPA